MGRTSTTRSRRQARTWSAWGLLFLLPSWLFLDFLPLASDSLPVGRNLEMDLLVTQSPHQPNLTADCVISTTAARFLGIAIRA